MDTTSPHVFVPPADTKERKSSIVLANSRRASAISVTTSTPTAQSSIPILNEPGMQPLLPLIPSEKVSPEKPSEVVEQKEESEALVENQDDGKESKSPETLPVVVKAPASVVELSEKDLVYLSSIFFFLRDHPDIFLDLARCCDSLSVLKFPFRLLVNLLIGTHRVNTLVCDENLCSLVK